MKQKENTENKDLFELRFHPTSFIIFILIFIVEVIIALFIDDRFIRPFGGDILVVMLMYYFVKTFVQTKPVYIAIVVLLFAYLVEIGQYYNLVEIVGMQHNRVMRIVIGSAFSWIDIICYTIGAAICYFVDRKN